MAGQLLWLDCNSSFGCLADPPNPRASVAAPCVPCAARQRGGQLAASAPGRCCAPLCNGRRPGCHRGRAARGCCDYPPLEPARCGGALMLLLLLLLVLPRWPAAGTGPEGSIPCWHHMQLCAESSTTCPRAVYLCCSGQRGGHAVQQRMGLRRQDGGSGGPAGAVQGCAGGGDGRLGAPGADCNAPLSQEGPTASDGWLMRPARLPALQAALPTSCVRGRTLCSPCCCWTACRSCWGCSRQASSSRKRGQPRLLLDVLLWHTFNFRPAQHLLRRASVSPSILPMYR